jgi:hypothetical protein
VPAPVDRNEHPNQFRGVKKKPAKIEEPKATYPAKKLAKAVAVRADSRETNDATFKRLTEKIFTERKDLLRKLAQ